MFIGGSSHPASRLVFLHLGWYKGLVEGLYMKAWAIERHGKIIPELCFSDKRFHARFTLNKSIDRWVEVEIRPCAKRLKQTKRGKVG